VSSQVERDHSLGGGHIVVFQPDGACLEAEPGQAILELARAAGVPIDSACGGQGTCGKCKVLIALGQPGGQPGDQLTPEEIEHGMVLACQATVEGDLVVEVPLESQRSELRILVDQGPLETETTGGVPLAERVPLSVSPPDQEDGRGDDERLLRALQDSRGARFSEFSLDLPALRLLPQLGRDHHWRLDALLGDFDGKGVIYHLAPPSDTEAYGLAVDIGTTTVVVHLINLATGGFVDACASLNDQVGFGADVISRIIHTQEHEGGLQQLREAVLDTINRCVVKAAHRAGATTKQIIAAACVGNTVMTHLALGIDPAAIRREPYVPAVCSLPTLRAGDVGIDIHPAAPVYFAPCVSSYVGGDITAGVLASAMADSPRLTLFIDLGTNGEMVIGHHDWLMCCSCSAGPAFEGSGLEYGMYATVGAIEKFTYDSATDHVEYLTIGQARPRGVCGSGLVDALAALLRAGAIDRSGRINLGFSSPRVRVRKERPEFVLVWGEEVGRADDISLGEDDIQNLIRSKSAVYAGAATLLDSLGIGVRSIERILVAGAFGNYLDAENAVTIGLLPEVPLDRIRFIGNTAVAGARLCLQSREARHRTEGLVGQMTNFELSLHPGYMERYVSGLFLPHTDLDLFPATADRLGLRP